MAGGTGAGTPRPVMVDNAYGKAGIRLVLVRRDRPVHELRDLTVDVRLSGELARVYTDGDNADVLPTDTMRSTVYALAQEHLTGSAESFGLVLARRFLAAAPATDRASVALREHPWQPVSTTAFTREAGTWTAEVSVTRTGEVSVRSGLADLVLLKTSGSAFSGFLRDEYTVLANTEDRVLATEVTAWWDYGTEPEGVDHDARREEVREALVDAFAGHESRSVQHTLHAMGVAVLDAVPEVRRVSLTLPNRHHVAVDLSAFGQVNDLSTGHAVFVATDRPYGVIEGTVTRER